MSTQRFSAPDQSFALTVSGEMCLFCVERRGIGCGPDLVGRTLLCLFQNGVKLQMFSQSSASGSFCFVVSRESRELVLAALSAELRDELQRREIVCLNVQDKVALLQLTPPSTFTSLSDKLAAAQINILAVAQEGAGLSLLIQQTDLPRAIAALDQPASVSGAPHCSVITLSHEAYSNGPQPVV